MFKELTAKRAYRSPIVTELVAAKAFYPAEEYHQNYYRSHRGDTYSNFYIEPKISASTKAPTGDYFKDFGFQAGVYFDYDYSALEENIPLALRGMFGYKYILSSVHVFAFDAMVRRMFRFSEKSTFGLGFGGSAALWFRPESKVAPLAAEEIIFLPSLVLGAGFEFNPVFVDYKLLLNRIGQNATILGMELYAGVRF